MPKHTIRGGCMIKRTRDQSYVSFYFAAFFIVWSVREVWFVQYMEKLDPASAAILSAIIKFSIWVLPVFLLIRMAEKKNPFYYLGLLSNVGKGIKWGILISFGLAVYFVVENAFIIDNGADFNLRLHDWLNTIILVGFIEEMFFAGFCCENIWSCLLSGKQILLRLCSLCSFIFQFGFIKI